MFLFLTSCKIYFNILIVNNNGNNAKQKTGNIFDYSLILCGKKFWNKSCSVTERDEVLSQKITHAKVEIPAGSS